MVGLFYMEENGYWCIIFPFILSINNDMILSGVWQTLFAVTML